jgi:transcriptional regulator with XRE-family HTH domain
MPRESADPIDIYVGKRVRMRRMMLGMSQSNLGEALGVSFQQLQKYEKGTNRISASRLQGVSQVLQAPVDVFFEGAPSDGGQSHSQTGVPSPQYVSDYLATSEGLHLTKAFMRIPDPTIRRAIVRLVEEIAESQMMEQPPKPHVTFRRTLHIRTPAWQAPVR